MPKLYDNDGRRGALRVLLVEGDAPVNLHSKKFILGAYRGSVAAFLGVSGSLSEDLVAAGANRSAATSRSVGATCTVAARPARDAASASKTPRRHRCERRDAGVHDLEVEKKTYCSSGLGTRSGVVAPASGRRSAASTPHNAASKPPAANG